MSSQFRLCLLSPLLTLHTFSYSYFRCFTFCRYLQYLYLTLYKKKLVTEWKQDSTTAQSKRNEEVLCPETMEQLLQIDIKRTKKSDEVTGKISQEQRLATKERIAAWREEQVTRKENEDVSFVVFVCIVRRRYICI